MKIKNLLSHSVELGDGRMIGAAGTTTDEREYGLEKLDKRDKQRERAGQLEVIVPVEAENHKPVDSEIAKSDKNGGKK